MKKLISALLVISFIFIGSACGSDTTSGGGSASTNGPPHVTETTTVYWVPKGKVYHVDESCSTLSRSTDIESGTPEEAKEAGKSRLCKVCGKDYIDDTN